MYVAVASDTDDMQIILTKSGQELLSSPINEHATFESGTWNKVSFSFFFFTPLFFTYVLKVVFNFSRNGAVFDSPDGFSITASNLLSVRIICYYLHKAIIITNIVVIGSCTCG